MAVVIDTNVLITANEKHPKAQGKCVLACIQALEEAMADTVLMDNGREIFDEYKRHCSHKGQPGSGDAFFKWLWDRQAMLQHCREIDITPHHEKVFEEFPDDKQLETFDKSDRKFVAVAIASRENPPIKNASDSDWWHHHEVLKKYVKIDFLCPELMTTTI